MSPDTRELTDRELLLRIHKHVEEMNGCLKDHHEDLYGCPERQIVGLKQMVLDHDDYIQQQRTVVKVLAGMVSVVSVSTLVEVLVWLL